MRPARMSDAAACALLAEYAGDFQHGLASLEEDQLEYTRIEFGSIEIKDNITFPQDSIEASGNRALRMRRAMEALNALSCCRGFGVEENAVFWRRYFSKKTQPTRRRETINALGNGLLSRFSVSVAPRKPVDQFAWAIVSCFSRSSASKSVVVRGEVHDRLRGFFEREPPMLDLELVVKVSDRDSGQSARRALREVSRMWENNSPFGQQERIVVCFQGSGDKTVLLELSDSLSLSGIEVRALDVEVVTCAPCSYTSELSELMGELVRVNTVRKLKLTFGRWDRQCCASVFSAIASMTLLEVFNVRCEDLADRSTDLPFSDDEAGYYLWATYALLTQALDRRDVSATLTFEEGSSEICQTMLQSASALIEPAEYDQFVFEKLELTPLPHGSTAILRSCSYLAHVGDSCASPAKVAENLRVAVILQNWGAAIIVYPGYGLMWVGKSSLYDWKIETLQIATSFGIVGSLRLWHDDLTSSADFLALVGCKLKHLSLENVRSKHSETFAEILRSCPCLTHLHVLQLEVISPLIEAYQNGNCQVSTLNFKYMPARAVRALLKSFLLPRSHVASVVKRLWIPLMTRRDVERMAKILRSNRRLEYVRVELPKRSVMPHEESKGMLRPFMDEPVTQNQQSERAAYTFLLAARHDRLLRLLPWSCVQIIVELAATPTLRHVSWAS